MSIAGLTLYLEGHYTIAYSSQKLIQWRYREMLESCCTVRFRCNWLRIPRSPKDHRLQSICTACDAEGEDPIFHVKHYYSILSITAEIDHFRSALGSHIKHAWMVFVFTIILF